MREDTDNFRHKVYMKRSAIDVLLNNLAVAEVGTVL